MSGGRRDMKSKNIIMLLVLIIAGILIGALIASATKNVQYLSWLCYAKSFGLDVNKPAVVDLSVLKVAFGFEVNISVAQVICLVIASLLYRKLR
jgi:hypothetical protein